jgi:hypothetical protein
VKTLPLRPRTAPRAAALAALVVAAVASPALALFPRLQATLSGPPIGGVAPRGEAKLDQSGQPDGPASAVLSNGSLWRF